MYNWHKNTWSACWRSSSKGELFIFTHSAASLTALALLPLLPYSCVRTRGRGWVCIPNPIMDAGRLFCLGCLPAMFVGTSLPWRTLLTSHHVEMSPTRSPPTSLASRCSHHFSHLGCLCSSFHLLGSALSSARTSGLSDCPSLCGVLIFLAR